MATAHHVVEAKKIACVADTHSAPHPRTHELLRALAPDAIIHAGDIGDLAVLDELGKIAPLYAVRGNIDTHSRGLPDVLVLEVGALRILVTHIAVAGPRLRGDAAKLARAEKAQLVVCGHSHVPFVGGEKGITVFNPGSAGPRRFALPIVFGTIELDPLRFGHVDCETGRAWTPP
jgi:putative phosphoesterase